MTHAPSSDDATGGLPRDLGDGLILRWAARADAEEVATFNMRHLSDDPANLETPLLHWTRDLMGGRHPTTSAADVTVVVDQKAGGTVVSSIVLIAQTWAYDGLPFPFGRPELVSTHPDYRRKGLVRAQFAAIHARSAARGELVQGITGIPWFYRQFGYAMALDRGGGRRLPWHRVEQLTPDQHETYRSRAATVDDIPLLSRLYDVHRSASLVSRVRTAAEWRWELAGSHPQSVYHRGLEIVADVRGQPAGYLNWQADEWGDTLAVTELAALPDQSLRAVCAFLGRTLKARADGLNKARRKPLTSLAFAMGTAHPAYDALGAQLEQPRPPYAWYMRVPDLPAFLRHVGPVLEKRLAASVMAGHSGTLRLDFYRSQLCLVFERGKLAVADTYTPHSLGDGDACFPDLTFLDLLFGHRSLADLAYAHADCFTRDPGAAVLLNILFPRHPSQPIALA